MLSSISSLLFGTVIFRPFFQRVRHGLNDKTTTRYLSRGGNELTRRGVIIITPVPISPVLEDFGDTCPPFHQDRGSTLIRGM